MLLQLSSPPPDVLLVPRCPRIQKTSRDTLQTHKGHHTVPQLRHHSLRFQVTLAQIHSVVPKHLHYRHTGKALFYVARDVLCAFIVYKLGWCIDPFATSLVTHYNLPSVFGTVAKWALWVLYWHWQGIILAGWWCMAHEAGHGSLSDHNWLNHLVGFSLHTVSPPSPLSVVLIAVLHL